VEASVLIRPTSSYNFMSVSHDSLSGNRYVSCSTVKPRNDVLYSNAGIINL